MCVLVMLLFLLLLRRWGVYRRCLACRIRSGGFKPFMLRLNRYMRTRKVTLLLLLLLLLFTLWCRVLLLLLFMMTIVFRGFIVLVVCGLV